ALEANLKKLFQTETELKQIITKCRHCFRDVIKNKPDMHGVEGRECMLAVCTDLKAAGAQENHIKMFARLMYGAGYNEAETLREWRNIDPAKTWQCDTLKAKLPAYIDPGQCEKCDERRQNFKQNVFEPLKDISFLRIAARLQEKTPIHYDRSGTFWLWIQDHYDRIDETDIMISLSRIVDSEKHILGRSKSAIMDAIKMTGRMREVKPVPKTWIHTQGAVIDLKTGERITPSPEYLLTTPIPHKLGLSKETPIIDRLFNEWVGPDKKQLLYEICAYCLLDDYPIHRLFLLFGRGRNGKGQFKEIILRLIGHSNSASTTIEGLTSNRFESARLFKKKVAIIGETNFAILEDTAIIKMLTGGDMIPGEFKNRTPFEFYNTAKLLINTNSLPPTADKTDAFYSRFIVVQFPNQFPKGKDIVDTVPAEEYDNLLLKCIDVLRDLLERGEFTNEGDIRAKEREYERLSNPLMQFLETYYDKDVDGKVAAWRVMEGYVSYCTEKGYRKPHSKKEFNDMLRVNYDVEKKTLIDDESENNKFECWVWVFGIRPKLSNLSNLSEFPLSTTIGESNRILDKLDKLDKSDNNGHDENLSFDSRSYTQESDKKPVTENIPVTDLSQQDIVGLIRSKINDLSKTFPAGPPGHVLMNSLESSGADMTRVREAVAHLTTKGILVFQNVRGSQCYHWAGV
ncbi:MAG: phage/plasmid primase, P4 family, partial [Methanobacteriota archaeon]